MMMRLFGSSLVAGFVLHTAVSIASGAQPEAGEADTPDYAQQLVDLAAAAQPAGDCNAWDGVKLFSDWWDARMLEDDAAADDVVLWALDPAERLYPCESPPEECAEWRAATDRTLERMRADGVFDRTIELLLCGRSEPPKIEGPLMEHIQPEFSAMRRWALIMLALAREDFAAGRSEEGARKVASALAGGRALAYGNFTISRLVAVGIEQLVLEHVEKWIWSGELAGDALDHLARSFEDTAGGPDLAYMVESERIFGHDTIARYRQKVGSGIEEAAADLPEELDPEAARAIARDVADFVAMGPRHLFATYDVAMDFHAALARATPAERRVMHRAFDVEAYLDALDARYEVVQVLYPAMSKAILKIDESRTQRHGLQVVIALERFKRDMGVYPELLDDLVPKYLGVLPPDLFSQDGATFAYHNADPHSLGGHGGYLLYSIGVDCEDNGGVLYRRKDGFVDNAHSLNCPQCAGGTDYIINYPPRGAVAAN